MPAGALFLFLQVGARPPDRHSACAGPSRGDEPIPAPAGDVTGDVRPERTARSRAERRGGARTRARRRVKDHTISLRIHDTTRGGARLSRVHLRSLDALTVDRLPARSITHRSTASRVTSWRNPTAVPSPSSAPSASHPSPAVARATGVTCSSRFSNPAARRGRTLPPPLLNPCRCTASSPRTASSPSTANPRCRRRSTTLSSSRRRRTIRPRFDASSSGMRKEIQLRRRESARRVTRSVRTEIVLLLVYE